MIRLTVKSQTPEEAVLEVHGWVSGKDVGLLEEEGTRLFQEAERLVLDLSGVKFIDRDGIALLQCWARKGVVLRGGSLFVRTLLEQQGVA